MFFPLSYFFFSAFNTAVAICFQKINNNNNENENEIENGIAVNETKSYM